LPPVGPQTLVGTAASPPAAPPTAPSDDPRVQTVVDLAADLLGRPVGPDDDLLGLGLDSLGATRLAARLARVLGVPAQVVTVLRERTPTALAAALPAPDGADHTTAHTTADAPVLSDGQIRFWLDDMMRPDRALGNIVLLAFRFAGPVPVPALHTGLRTIVARHDALRTAVADEDGVPTPVPLPVDRAVRIDHEPAGPADPYAHAAALASAVDLSAGPIVAASTVTLPDGVLLVLAVHHAAFDGDSVALLATELSTLLRGESLPAVRPYATCVARRATGVAGSEVKRLATEWADRLCDAEDLRWPGPDPTDGRVPTRAAIAEIDLTIPAETAAALAGRARGWRVTPYTVALTAFTHALYEVTGVERFCVASPVSDREPADGSTIGLFITTLALPARAGDPHGAGAVARTAATVLDGLAHRAAPLGYVLRLLRRRAGSRHPLFQAQFAWQNHAPARWDIPGVEVAQVRVPPLVAQHELTVELYPPSGPGPFTGVVEYDPGAVGSGVARSVADAFLRALDRLCCE
jgi:aryl carrier-like protein